MKLYSQGVLIFGFTDYRDAKRAYANAQQDNPEWRLVRLSPKAHALNSEESYVLGQRNLAYVSDFEGQITAVVYFNGRDDSIKAQPTFELLKQTLCAFGEIKAFHSIPYKQANLREIRVEYFDTRCAENAVRSLNETRLGVSTSALAREHVVDIFHRASTGIRQTLQTRCLRPRKHTPKCHRPLYSSIQ
jgi:hypothetical protein